MPSGTESSKAALRVSVVRALAANSAGPGLRARAAEASVTSGWLSLATCGPLHSSPALGARFLCRFPKVPAVLFLPTMIERQDLGQSQDEQILLREAAPGTQEHLSATLYSNLGKKKPSSDEVTSETETCIP